jgi:hypothetical protein
VWSSDPSTPVPAKRIEATLLAFDAANAQVTYLTKPGDRRTSPVSSAVALEKLARMKPGRKVVLTCREDTAVGLSVEDVKGKANWWKRGLIITTILVITVAGIQGLGDIQ